MTTPTLADALQRSSIVYDRVTIETANVEFDESYCSQDPEVTPGSYVMVAVSDNGIGIPPENLSRIFDLYFTTKK